MLQLLSGIWFYLAGLLPWFAGMLLPPAAADKPASRPDLVVRLAFDTLVRANDPASDTLFYAPGRKLAWDDFRGKPPVTGPSGAVAYTSFSYEGSSSLRKDTLVITLQLQVFFVRSASWVRFDNHSDYALIHEQLHFDITRLVAERFKQKLKQTALNRDDYDSVIQYQYLQSFREMNRLQYAFDHETNHGTNPLAQARWRDNITIALKNNGTLPEELGNDFLEKPRDR